jgi:uncharacterized protein (UPF0332 family)
MSWARGREEVRRLIEDGEVELVEASVDVAERLLRDAEAHVRLASLGVEEDPAGALQLSYDAARKASTALLAVQGLRATTRGGHVAVIDAVRAQFSERGGLPVFGQINRLRRRRNDTEYPKPTTPTVTSDEATHALDTAREVIDSARKLIETGRLDEFR